MVDNHRTVVIPTIDIISNDTFEYKRQGFKNEFAGRGMLDLNFQYKVLPLTLSIHTHPTFETPIMSAGIFAIHANFFWHLGGFDEGIDTWGKIDHFHLNFSNLLNFSIVSFKVVNNLS